MNASDFPWIRPPFDLEAWEAAGVPLATARVIDTLWSWRLIPWAGLEPAEEAAWTTIWRDAQDLTTLDDVRQWVARTREHVWGDPRPVSEQQEQWEHGEGPRRWGRARRLLGPRLANWLADDEWAIDAERWYLRPPASGWSFLEKVHASRHSAGKGRSSAAALSLPSVGSLRAQAARLCDRFGLCRFSTSGDFKPDDLRHGLGKAEDGMGAFATALGWEDAEVGASHLSLAFELEPDDDMAACLDPLTHTLSIGREGWGSFAHEWSHALDLALGAHWSTGRSGYPRYGSDIAEEPTCFLPEEHRMLRSFLQRRDHEPSQTGFSLHRQLIASIPEVMGDLSKDVPDVWFHRLDVRLRALDNWVDAAQRGGSNPERLRQQWAQWCMGNHIAWSDPDDASVRPWRSRWKRLETVAGTLAFGPAPTRRVWALWAAGKDALAASSADAGAYHDTPHERFARSFHAYLRATLGQDTWAAGPANRPDQFPTGPDLEHCQRWWPKVLREIKPIWLARGLGTAAHLGSEGTVAARRRSRGP